MDSTIDQNRRAQREIKKVKNRENSVKKVSHPKDIVGGHKIFPTDNGAAEDFELKCNKPESKNRKKQDSLGSIEGLQDRLLDFQDINEAITNTSTDDPTFEILQRSHIRCRRYNPKTGDFTSAQNSSEDDSDDYKKHETTIRYKKKKIVKTAAGCCQSSQKDFSDSFTPEPMMHTFVGFLRLANFICAATVLFGLVTEKLITLELAKDNPSLLNDISNIPGFKEGTTDGIDNQTTAWSLYYTWRRAIYHMTSYTMIFYVSVVAVVMIVDSVSTLTFRWKEYGELTHYHADATSIVFLFTRSRWLLRGTLGLVLASSVSLGFLPIIAHYMKGSPPKIDDGKDNSDKMYNAYLKDAAYWFVGLSASSLISTMFGLFINAYPWHNVAWLYDTVRPEQIEDKDDLWVKTWGTPLNENHHGGQSEKALLQEEEEGWVSAHKHGNPTSCTRILHLASNTLSTIILVTHFLVSTFLTGYTLLIANKDMDEMDFDPRTKEIASFDNFVVFFGSIAILLLNVFILLYIVVRLSDTWCRGKTFYMHGKGNLIPYVVRFLAPYSLTSSAKLLFDVQDIDSETGTKEGLEEMKMITCHLWTWLMLLTILLSAFNIFVNFYHKFPSIMKSIYDFLRKSIFNRLEGDSSGGGVSKGLIRFLDTFGTLCALIGLILGISSLFIDQYDFSFEPQGIIKEVFETCETFQKAFKSVLDEMENIIRSLQQALGFKDVTCEHVYTAVSTGVAITLFTSFIPGASSITTAGTKGSYYVIRFGNSITNLYKKLGRNKRKIWGIVKVINGIVQFSFKNLKKIIIGTGGVSLMQLLPLFPPIYVGFRVFFAAFWPKRIMFFSAKQRRKTTSGMFWDWLVTIILLLVTVVVNTALLDEIVAMINQQLCITEECETIADHVAVVTVDRKLGWRIAMAGNAFAIIAAISNCVATFILQWQTSRNHENITNAELDWKNELEKRELEQILTPHGVKLERRTQLKYKKERIGPWTWMVPILLALIACGFGILANFHPKMEMAREPRGNFGEMLDKVYRKIESYKTDVYAIGNDTELECMPFNLPTIADVPNNPLTSPVKEFVAYALKLLKPIHDVISGARKQLLLDVDDQLYNSEATNENVWRDNNLQYIGMILMVPRVICLLILIFGMMASSLFVCQMQIIECIEPRKLVDAFKNVTIFSVIYVVGAQLSLFNMISAFGVPFYKIYVRFGLGFVYDVVADSILVATYIGMQNEFFFAIPKKKTTVTYSVPGVSAEGPNVPGTIL